jgi:hypothetical protein
MRLPIDIAAHVSPELSALIDRLIDDPDVDEPVTLGVVRQSVGSDVLAEVDRLIQRCSDRAAAIDFAAAKASDQLSIVIETIMNDPGTRRRVTLGAVREALAGEDETLLAETEDLIERFGADAVAEHLLRYE